MRFVLRDGGGGGGGGSGGRMGGGGGNGVAYGREISWDDPLLKESSIISFLKRLDGWTDVRFLDASSNLYKRVCPSIRPLVGQLVRL